MTKLTSQCFGLMVWNRELGFYANCQDMFLIKPQIRQIILLSRNHPLCLLEQDLFFAFYKDLKDYQEDK